MTERNDFGRCPQCGQLVGLTKRGLVVRHDRWIPKGLSIKAGRYRGRCDGSFQPAAVKSGDGPS